MPPAAAYSKIPWVQNFLQETGLKLNLRQIGLVRKGFGRVLFHQPLKFLDRANPMRNPFVSTGDATAVGPQFAVKVKKARREVTSFERYIMEEVQHRETIECEQKIRRRDGLPLVDENPYTATPDLRMGRGTLLRDLLPHLRSVMRYEQQHNIERCVLRLSAKYRTVGEVYDVLHSADGERWYTEQSEKHGAVFVNLELLVRAVVSQERMRWEVAERNRQGVLTPSLGERIYALQGEVQLSSGLPPSGRPECGTADPGGYGPWKWYESDFGTDHQRLREKLSARLVGDIAVSERGMRPLYHNAHTSISSTAAARRKGLNARIRPMRTQVHWKKGI